MKAKLDHDLVESFSRNNQEFVCCIWVQYVGVFSLKASLAFKLQMSILISKIPPVQRSDERIYPLDAQVSHHDNMMSKFWFKCWNISLLRNKNWTVVILFSYSLTSSIIPRFYSLRLPFQWTMCNHVAVQRGPWNYECYSYGSM